MERLGDSLRDELTRLGPEAGIADVLVVWPESVGTMVAANAWPARIARDGTLYVNTSSSAWAFELGHLAPTILERLVENLGESAPKALRFAVGHLPEPSPEELGEARTEVPEPGVEALQRAAELAAAIDDEELRKRVQRAAALGLSSSPSDRRF
jgi:predicted nucleic acid-binding Zn ribbon protein